MIGLCVLSLSTFVTPAAFAQPKLLFSADFDGTLKPRVGRGDPILTGAEHSAALARANDHEITTIAVSVIAAEHAGQPLDPRTIADSAVDGANVRDLGNAEAVTALICAAMKRPAVQRWGRELGRFLGTTYVLATGPVRNNR